MKDNRGGAREGAGRKSKSDYDRPSGQRVRTGKGRPAGWSWILKRSNVTFCDAPLMSSLSQGTTIAGDPWILTYPHISLCLGNNAGTMSILFLRAWELFAGQQRSRRNPDFATDRAAPSATRKIWQDNDPLILQGTVAGGSATFGRFFSQSINQPQLT